MLPFYYHSIESSVSQSTLDSDEFSSTLGPVDFPVDYYCLSINNVFKTKRIFDMAASTIGIILNSIHIGILVYIKLMKKARSYELLLGQGVLAFLTHLFLLLGCLVDLCMVGVSESAAWFRAHIWLFLVNTFMASYGFLIIALCIDRYVALNRPIYYRHTFVRRRTRWGLIIGSCILGMIFCLRWIPFNRVTEDNDIEENTTISRTWYYTTWRIMVYLEQYVFAGIAMIVLSYSNIRKLEEIKRSYKEETLGMTGEIKVEWIRNHTTISKICAVLAISYVMFNWPYCIVDYLYTDDISIFGWPYRSTKDLILRLRFHRSSTMKKIVDSRESTTTQNTVFTVC
ncbi:unnamed protein product, partial [Mesorhabditis belari]|uniref:G-protein coupled receptors family 1 profile domain-containing protein n=1 Tax=Mesorhabditis belari TaxID=2138241 RepID=A0AAF3J215_9BILA